MQGTFLSLKRRHSCGPLSMARGWFRASAWIEILARNTVLLLKGRTRKRSRWHIKALFLKGLFSTPDTGHGSLSLLQRSWCSAPNTLPKEMHPEPCRGSRLALGAARPLPPPSGLGLGPASDMGGAGLGTKILLHGPPPPPRVPPVIRVGAVAAI